MTETTERFGMILGDIWDTELTQIVGEIAISFSQLEHALWVLPKRIKQLSISEWADIAGKVPIPTRCNQIREAFELAYMHQELESQLGRLLVEVEDINHQRNAVVHGRWGYKKKSLPDGPIVSRHRFFNEQDQGIDLEELKQLRAKIRNLRDQLLHFVPPTERGI